MAQAPANRLISSLQQTRLPLPIQVATRVDADGREVQASLGTGASWPKRPHYLLGSTGNLDRLKSRSFMAASLVSLGARGEGNEEVPIFLQDREDDFPNAADYMAHVVATMTVRSMLSLMRREGVQFSIYTRIRLNARVEFEIERSEHDDVEFTRRWRTLGYDAFPTDIRDTMRKYSKLLQGGQFSTDSARSLHVIPLRNHLCEKLRVWFTQELKKQSREESDITGMVPVTVGAVVMFLPPLTYHFGCCLTLPGRIKKYSHVYGSEQRRVVNCFSPRTRHGDCLVGAVLMGCRKVGSEWWKKNHPILTPPDNRSSLIRVSPNRIRKLMYGEEDLPPTEFGMHYEQDVERLAQLLNIGISVVDESCELIYQSTNQMECCVRISIMFDRSGTHPGLSKVHRGKGHYLFVDGRPRIIGPTGSLHASKRQDSICSVCGNFYSVPHRCDFESSEVNNGGRPTKRARTTTTTSTNAPTSSSSSSSRSSSSGPSEAQLREFRSVRDSIYRAVFEEGPTSHVLLVGPGGTGKSVMLRQILQRATGDSNGEFSVEGRIVLLAPTNMVAKSMRNAGVVSYTLDSFLGWTKRALTRKFAVRSHERKEAKKKALTGSSVTRSALTVSELFEVSISNQAVVQRIASARVFLLDEIGSVCGSALEVFFHLVRAVHKEQSDLVQFIMTGDMLQLPPPTEGFIWFWKCSAWKYINMRLRVYCRTDTYRFRYPDKEWSDLLDGLRVGEVSQHHREFLRKLEVPSVVSALERLRMERNRSFTIVCGTHRTRQRVQALMKSGYDYRHRPGTHHRESLMEEHPPSSGWMAKRTTLEPRLVLSQGSSYVYVGANRLGDGLVRGQTVVMEDVGQNLSDAVVCSLYHCENGMEVRVSIAAVEETYVKGGDRQGQEPRTTHTLRQYPLLPKDVMTAHRLQGATVTDKMIVCDDLFAQHHNYVALSRARKSEQVAIVNVEKFLDSVHVCPEALSFWQRCRSRDWLSCELTRLTKNLPKEVFRLLIPHLEKENELVGISSGTALSKLVREEKQQVLEWLGSSSGSTSTSDLPPSVVKSLDPSHHCGDHLFWDVKKYPKLRERDVNGGERQMIFLDLETYRDARRSSLDPTNVLVPYYCAILFISSSDLTSNDTSKGEMVELCSVCLGKEQKEEEEVDLERHIVSTIMERILEDRLRLSQASLIKNVTLRTKTKRKYSHPRVLVAYNGSRFDFQIVVGAFQRWIGEHGEGPRARWEARPTLANGGAIVAFDLIDLQTQTIALKMFDPCQVTKCTLDKAMKNFLPGSPVAKDCFPMVWVNKNIQKFLRIGKDERISVTLEDFYAGHHRKHASELSQAELDSYPIHQKLHEYGPDDTRMVAMLWFKLNELSIDTLGVPIHKFTTGASMCAYGMATHFPKWMVKKVPLQRPRAGAGQGNANSLFRVNIGRFTEETNREILSAQVGGKCVPNALEWESPLYGKGYEEVIRDPKAYYKFFDAVSLYPSSFHYMPYGKWTLFSGGVAEGWGVNFSFHTVPFLRPNDPKDQLLYSLWLSSYEKTKGLPGSSVPPEVCRLSATFDPDVWALPNFPLNDVWLVECDLTIGHKHDLDPPFATHEPKTHRLRWECGMRSTQVVTIIDLCLILSRGGELHKVLRCWSFEGHGRVFDSWVTKCFRGKQEAGQKGLKALRSMWKLFLNGSYGKLIERGHSDVYYLIRSIEEWEHAVNECEDPTIINWQSVLASTKVTREESRFLDRYFPELGEGGENKEEEEEEEEEEPSPPPPPMPYLFLKGQRPTDASYEPTLRPTLWGMLTLSYSRVLMGHWRHLGHPDARAGTMASVEGQILYGDTDSILVAGKNCPSLEREIGDGLGQLQNDLGEGAIVVRFLSMGPKKYMVEYLMPGETFEQRHFKVRFGGVNLGAFEVKRPDEPSSTPGEMNASLFEECFRHNSVKDTMEEKISFVMRERIVRTGATTRDNRDPFSMFVSDMWRTPLASLWEGRRVLLPHACFATRGNKWTVPHGWECVSESDEEEEEEKEEEEEEEEEEEGDQEEEMERAMQRLEEMEASMVHQRLTLDESCGSQPDFSLFLSQEE